MKVRLDPLESRLHKLSKKYLHALFGFRMKSWRSKQSGHPGPSFFNSKTVFNSLARALVIGP
jgi:hypothetical protein